MLNSANITVYVQALGAHFLGINAFNVKNITVKLNYSLGEINIPYIIPSTPNDGVPSPTFGVGLSSFMPIITLVKQAPAVVTFLNANRSTIAAKNVFSLPSQNELATITVSVPITSSTKPLVLTQQLLLSNQITNYKTTIVVPGLYLQPAVVKGSIAVFVKMMCGCPVTLGPPASLWPSSDFIVTANVLDVNNATTPYILSYQNPQPTNSLFADTLFPNQKTIKSVTFFAHQISTGNYSTVVQ